MGISVTKTDDGKIQLMQDGSSVRVSCFALSMREVARSGKTISVAQGAS